MSAAPAVVIAAASSGAGKTTLATGVMAALARRGPVAPFKVGPDYIDPGYHRLATGRAGRNLDPVLCGAGRVGPLYAHGAAGARIAVVEGVMGLFDGRIGGDPLRAEGSTAEVAALLGAPVVLVVDARAMSQSTAALVHGFATFDPRVAVAGVILNRVGSPRHAAAATAAIEAAGTPVLGAVPRVDGAAVPSRHLGLVTADEGGAAAAAAVAAMADLVEAHVDLDRLVALAGLGAGVAERPWDPAAELGAAAAAPGTGPRVALAAGPAFSFAYAEHAELLAAAGAAVAVFDPLVDELPEAAAVILPGGFPEEHAEALSARADLAAALRAAVDRGAVVHAECAGLLLLLEELGGLPMCGVLPGSAAMSPRLTLGYREAVALSDSALGPAGARVRGHEFHRTALDAAGLRAARAAGWTPAWGWRDERGPVTEGLVHPSGRVHASYLHVHPAGNPAGIAALVAAAR